MQLLNTFTNMGGTWPKWFVLKGKSLLYSLEDKFSFLCTGVDLLSDATCKVADVGVDIAIQGSNLLL
jgi:PAT family acetyl-CoA transporter-like MFS transporter 1